MTDPRFIKQRPLQDQTTDDEVIGPEERAELADPNVGHGTPDTAPEVPPAMTLVERLVAKLRR